MAGISPVTNSLIQSQLSKVRTRQAIETQVAVKTLNTVRDQGAAMVSLLDEAAQAAQQMNQQQPVTYGMLVSGLGQKLDTQA